jgi:hypothetical protein
MAYRDPHLDNPPRFGAGAAVAFLAVAAASIFSFIAIGEAQENVSARIVFATEVPWESPSNR